MTVDEVIAIAKTLRPGFKCIYAKFYNPDWENHSTDYYIEYVYIDAARTGITLISDIGWTDLLQRAGWKG